MHICIIQPALNKVSETFIRAHVERLPGLVTSLHGRIPCVGGVSVLSQAVAARAWRKCGRVIARRTWEWERTAGYLAAFRRFKPDVVLAEYGPTGVAAMEACRIAKLPLVVHFHGYDATQRDVLEGHRDAYGRLFDQSVAVIAVSRAMQERLIAKGCPENKLHLNHYGIDCAQFGGADPAGAPATFVAVGRFVEKKAPHLTISAFAQTAKAIPNVRLRMIGNGPLLAACRDLAEGLCVSDRINFLGPQPSGVVQEEMRQARCFVQHSVEASNGDCEGTPVAILEAGASGLPVVSTRHAGIPDVVIERRTGLLVDERDVGGMAKAMTELALDATLAGGLGRAARDHVSANYTVERSINRLATILNRAANVTPLRDEENERDRRMLETGVGL